MSKGERTLCLIKNHAIEMQLVGAIITRFEYANFQIVEMKTVTPTLEIAGLHYPAKKEWLSNVAQKAEEALGKEDFIGIFGSSVLHEKIGLQIRGWIINGRRD